MGCSARLQSEPGRVALADPRHESDIVIAIARLWGRGHPGPADVPLPRHKEGDFPIAESMGGKVLAYPGHIEDAAGFIDQLAAAFGKVAEQHGELL
mgnify:CR=1 FL=1